MGALNLFRILADCSHLFGAVFLIVGVIRSKSSVSFSLRSMELYFLVFLTRYLDLNRANWDWGVTVLGTYNVVGKAFLLVLSLLAILVVRLGVVEYHHKQKDASVVSYVLLVACAFVTALVVAFDHHPGHAHKTHGARAHNAHHSFIESAYVFSRVLESVAIAPQILLLSRLKGSSQVVVTYIGALGLYRLFYIVNWAWRYAREGHFDKFAFWCGVVQFGLLAAGLAIALYWKRQRDRWLRDSDGIEFHDVTTTARHDGEKQPLLKSI